MFNAFVTAVKWVLFVSLVVLITASIVTILGIFTMFLSSIVPSAPKQFAIWIGKYMPFNTGVFDAIGTILIGFISAWLSVYVYRAIVHLIAKS